MIRASTCKLTQALMDAAFALPKSSKAGDFWLPSSKFDSFMVGNDVLAVMEPGEREFIESCFNCDELSSVSVQGIGIGFMLGLQSIPPADWLFRLMSMRTADGFDEAGLNTLLDDMLDSGYSMDQLIAVVRYWTVALFGGPDNALTLLKLMRAKVSDADYGPRSQLDDVIASLEEM